jgi:hypothetical protein
MVDTFLGLLHGQPIKLNASEMETSPAKLPFFFVQCGPMLSTLAQEVILFE